MRRGTEGSIESWTIRPTKTERVLRPTTKKFGTFSPISLGLQEKVPK